MLFLVSIPESTVSFGVSARLVMKKRWKPKPVLAEGVTWSPLNRWSLPHCLVSSSCTPSDPHVPRRPQAGPMTCRWWCWPRSQMMLVTSLPSTSGATSVASRGVSAKSAKHITEMDLDHLVFADMARVGGVCLIHRYLLTMPWTVSLRGAIG